MSEPLSFIFLEIKDPLAAALLQDLRSIFKRRESRSPIHITVRGPYKSTPSSETLEDLWLKVKGEGLLLSGIGRFEFPEKDIVFLRSHSKAIRRIWWKRDFPIIRYGFNPHITLFEGDSKSARAVELFLKRERLELFCRQLALTLYETGGDGALFPPRRTELFSVSASPTSPLITPARWQAGIQDRAKALMQELIKPTAA